MRTCARNRIARISTFMLALCALFPAYAPAAEMRDLINQIDVYSTTAEQAAGLLGEPADYVWGDKTYTKDNLPATYIMRYPESVNIVIVRNRVEEVRFEQGAAWYVFGQNIRIGSSMEDVFAELGQPVRVLNNEQPNLVNRTLYRNIRPGTSYYCCGERNVRIFFVNDKVTAIYLWAGSRGNAGGGNAGRTRQLNEFADVRAVDIRNIDLSQKANIIPTLTFSTRTQWPSADKLPEDFDPQAWIDAAMNPGFKIRTLHGQAITGRGVSIGVIGFQMSTGHPEYAERIAWYNDVGAGLDVRQKGGAIAGLLAGAKCGVAPEADLYYCAVKANPSESDYVEALARLIEVNKSLDAEQKIKLVCVPAAPGDGARQSKAGQETWEDACIAAEQAGMLIIDGTHRHGRIRQCSYDASAPDDITLCIPGAPDKTPIASPNNLYAPTSPRTVPQSSGKDVHDYAFYGRGDSSWSIPYCVGVLALGWQLNPQLTGQELLDRLYKTAYTTPDNAKIIYPLMFVTEVAKE